ncbi:MAG: DUF805 domain-containing protein [Bacteroidales bacterium]|nr:DUF805 domain-containing protein [Bacteroidales bacterium]
MKWFLKCLKQYADFTGRARRKEYWWFSLINCLISMVLLVGMMVPIFKAAFGPSASEDFNEWDVMRSIFTNPFLYIYIIFYLAMLVPGLAVMVRRLHDIGKSGYWSILIIGGSVLGNISRMLSDTCVIAYALVTLAVIAILIVSLIWLFSDSEYGPNQYGPNPKGDGNQPEPQTNANTTEAQTE